KRQPPRLHVVCKQMPPQIGIGEVYAATRHFVEQASIPLSPSFSSTEVLDPDAQENEVCVLHLASWSPWSHCWSYTATFWSHQTICCSWIPWAIVGLYSMRGVTLREECIGDDLRGLPPGGVVGG